MEAVYHSKHSNTYLLHSTATKRRRMTYQQLSQKPEISYQADNYQNHRITSKLNPEMVPISLVPSNNSHVITCTKELEILVLKPLTLQQ